METLVNEETQLIRGNIPTVLKYLFNTYGKIPSKEVKQKEAEICAMPYHPADPMILLFNPIEKLKKIAKSTSIEYTTAQILDIGLTVVRNTPDFKRALGDWVTIPNNDKTWDHFKSHFKDAQKQLCAIRGPAMQ